jgi:hypothetical protein
LKREWDAAAQVKLPNLFTAVIPGCYIGFCVKRSLTNRNSPGMADSIVSPRRMKIRPNAPLKASNASAPLMKNHGQEANAPKSTSS